MIWAQLVGSALSFISQPKPPTQDQINAALAAQAAQERQNLMLGGALFGGALLLLVLARR